ncbi:hypothetical protein [Vibrio fujianensis]|uniref:hypothetical protein n=1 Tax=Vibrio fujianensis TaxID=1974215 RepID=UPI000C16A600|nr:hypothetical protein [Vibrio fujianensis]
MKKIALLLFACLLSACSSSPDVNWQHSNAGIFSQTAIQLKSNLWIDQMPKVADDQNTTNQSTTDSLNGTLVLQTSGQLPADLTILMLVIRQDELMWSIPASELELRTPSDNVWEIVFQSSLGLDADRSVSVALGVRDNSGDTWLVEHQVVIDKVY